MFLWTSDCNRRRDGPPLPLLRILLTHVVRKLIQVGVVHLRKIILILLREVANVHVWISLLLWKEVILITVGHVFITGHNWLLHQFASTFLSLGTPVSGLYRSVRLISDVRGFSELQRIGEVFHLFRVVDFLLRILLLTILVYWLLFTSLIFRLLRISPKRINKQYLNAGSRLRPDLEIPRGLLAPRELLLLLPINRAKLVRLNAVMTNRLHILIQLTRLLRIERNAQIVILCWFARVFLIVLQRIWVQGHQLWHLAGLHTCDYLFFLIRGRIGIEVYLEWVRIVLWGHIFGWHFLEALFISDFDEGLCDRSGKGIILQKCLLILLGRAVLPLTFISWHYCIARIIFVRSRTLCWIDLRTRQIVG